MKTCYRQPLISNAALCRLAHHSRCSYLRSVSKQHGLVSAATRNSTCIEKALWFSPSWQLTTMQLLTHHTLPQWDGEENLGEKEIGNLLVNSLIIELE